MRVFAYRQLKIKLLFDFVYEQHGPGIRMEEFVDFLHDRAQNLIELQRGSEGLPELVKDGHFAGFPAFRRQTGVAPALDARKHVAFRHFRL
jgi:hypothetical protein